jgi:hypothetical protein
MATERLSMRKTREILRLKWELRRSHREIARALAVGLATVSDTAALAKAAHLDWVAVTALSDEQLDAKIYPKAPSDIERPLPDPATLDKRAVDKGDTETLRKVVKDLWSLLPEDSEARCSFATTDPRCVGVSLGRCAIVVVTGYIGGPHVNRDPVAATDRESRSPIRSRTRSAVDRFVQHRRP